MPANDADYQRDYRSRNPGYVRTNRMRRRARGRAMERLAVAHQSEFNEMFKVALKEVEAEPES